jgi:hypothetical protein
MEERHQWLRVEIWSEKICPRKAAEDDTYDNNCHTYIEKMLASPTRKSRGGCFDTLSSRQWFYRRTPGDMLSMISTFGH